MSDSLTLATELVGASALAGAAVWAAQRPESIETRELRLPAPLAPSAVEELVRVVSATARTPVTVTLEATGHRGASVRCGVAGHAEPVGVGVGGALARRAV